MSADKRKEIAAAIKPLTKELKTLKEPEAIAECQKKIDDLKEQMRAMALASGKHKNINININTKHDITNSKTKKKKCMHNITETTNMHN